MANKSAQVFDRSDLRSWAEERLGSKAVTAPPPGTTVEQVHLIHELQVYQIELEMQNAELQLTIDEQHKTELLLGKYTDLYDFAPVGYMVLSRNGTVRAVNLTCANFLGIERSRLVNRQFRYFFAEIDFPAINTFLDSTFTSLDKNSCEVYLLKEGWQPLFVRMEAVPAESGEECRVAIIDITERKLAEIRLKQAYDELELKVAERTSALAKAHEQMKKVSFELVWAEERERERIAGELHDQVGQSLLLAKMKLDSLADSILSDSLRTLAEEVSSLVESSIHDIRSLTFRMRPPILDTAGIETALKWLCSSIRTDYKLHVDFVDDCQTKLLSAEARYSLYQAVRELLLNVVKHAGTENAQLSIATENNMLIVQVVDHGVGFCNPDALFKHSDTNGYGLYNVQQRIEQMGGRFSVESSPGSGTSVTLVIPLIEC